MKKWAGISVIVVLSVLLGLSCVVGTRAADRASFGSVQENEEYRSQVIQSDGENFVIYQNVLSGKFGVEKTDKNLKDFQTVGTVHQGEVYQIFQYKENQKQFLGMEPLLKKDEQQWKTPVFEVKGTFLAAGSTKTDVFVSILGEDKKTITEYILSLEDMETGWMERIDFHLTEEHQLRLAAYDENQLIFQRTDGKVFCCDVVIEEIEAEDAAVLVGNLNKSLMYGAESTWNMHAILCSMDDCFVPALIMALLIVLFLYGCNKKEPIMYRVLGFTESISSLCVVVIGYLCAIAVIQNDLFIIEDKIEIILLIKLVVYIVFVIITLVHLIAAVVMAKRWKRFTKAMEYVATEKKAYTEIPTEQDGLQMVWTPLDVIGRTMVRTEYQKDMMYKNYFRFVPKGMHQLLEKQEMAEVSIGDYSSVNGCMVHFSIENIKDYDASEYMSIMTDSLNIMHKVRVKHGGMFHSAGADLLERKVFFQQNPKAALHFAVDLVHAYNRKGSLKNVDFMFMLHLSDYYYGISGVEDMMTPFMFCKEEKILEPYIKELTKAKVKIALTEQTLSLVGNDFSVRYIGFISDKKMGDIKIYECLDAYQEQKRKQMETTKATFQNALNLFYSNDFYLARNAFNDVLKINEQDQIARWYLFHCEYHLNHPDAEISYELFENRN